MGKNNYINKLLHLLPYVGIIYVFITTDIKHGIILWITFCIIGIMNDYLNSFMHGLFDKSNRDILISIIMILSTGIVLCMIVLNTCIFKDILSPISTFTINQKFSICIISESILYLSSRQFSDLNSKFPYQALSLFISGTFTITLCLIGSLVFWK